MKVHIVFSLLTICFWVLTFNETTFMLDVDKTKCH